MCPPNLVKTCNLQGFVDDLTVINFDNFKRDPSFGNFRGERTFYDESIHFLMVPPITGVATGNVREDPPPVTVSIRFPIAPAPVTVTLAAAPLPLPPPAMAATAVPLVAPDTTDNAAEPPTPERHTLPTQDLRFTDDNIFQNNELPNFVPIKSTSDGSNLSFTDND